MALNYPNIIFFTLSVIAILTGYYKLILTVDIGQDKKMKMFKRMLTLLIVMGFIQIYSVSEDNQMKTFLLVIFAVIFNIYTVVSSTKKCNYPRTYVVRLALMNMFLTLLLSGLFWYASTNTFFGFMIIDDNMRARIESTVDNTFESDDVDDSYRRDEDDDCPESGSTDYDREMNLLREDDLQAYNDCLEKEARHDLAIGV